jgi:urease accessory protein
VTEVVDDHAWLAALQLADSLFPSGAFTQSHGLEALAADGLLANQDALAAVIETSLRQRLATADLPALLAAHHAAEASAHSEVREIDRLLATTKLAREEREASTRVGRRIAIEAARLAAPTLPCPRGKSRDPDDIGSPASGGGERTALYIYIEGIDDGSTPGNASVAQGVAAAALGVPAKIAALGACHSLVASLISAAMRLTRLGHGDAQAALREAQPAMADAVAAAERVDWRSIRSSCIQLDVAMARHERAETRMFAS